MDRILIYSPWKVSKLPHKGLITASTVNEVKILLRHDLYECDTMLNRHSHRRLPVTVKPLGTMKSQFVMNLIKLVLQSLHAGKFADS